MDSDSDNKMCLVRKWRSKKSPSTNQEFACHIMTGKPRHKSYLISCICTWQISSVAAIGYNTVMHIIKTINIGTLHDLKQ